MKVSLYLHSDNWTHEEAHKMSLLEPIQINWDLPNLPRKGDLLEIETGVPDFIPDTIWEVKNIHYKMADGKTFTYLWLEEEKC